MDKVGITRLEKATATLALSALAFVVVLMWVLLFIRQDHLAADVLRETSTAPRSEVTSSPASTEPSPSPSPSTEEPPLLQIGEKFTAENSDTTLLQVRKINVPADQVDATGGGWMGLRASTCVHADAAPSGRLPLSSWVAEDGRGTRYPGAASPWDGYPAQQFSTEPIASGTCNVGWVLIALPDATYKKIKTVVFRPSSPSQRGGLSRADGPEGDHGRPGVVPADTVSGGYLCTARVARPTGARSLRQVHAGRRRPCREVLRTGPRKAPDPWTTGRRRRTWFSCPSRSASEPRLWHCPRWARPPPD